MDRNPRHRYGVSELLGPRSVQSGVLVAAAAVSPSSGAAPEPPPLPCACRPVPELPGKSTFFVGSTDEFVEKRRQGLQQFLEK